jgi:hypothetical protein
MTTMITADAFHAEVSTNVLRAEAVGRFRHTTRVVRQLAAVPGSAPLRTYMISDAVGRLYNVLRYTEGEHR